MRHVFIVGSKGIPAQYGGYETFLDKLTEYHQDPEIKYHIACAVDSPKDLGEFEYHGAHCFNVLRRPIGSARAIVYDIDALKWCIKYIREHAIAEPIVYVLACRIGPVFGRLVNQIHRLGGKVYINPDGHEWARAKWSAPVRKYWKLSERLMVKHADLVVCDSLNIERYIQDEYERYAPRTTYIAYGAELTRSTLADDDERFLGWLAQHDLAPDDYYLVVGRFVPENNFETMIREFMASNTKRSFALITGVDEAFLAKLEQRTGFRKDARIKFVGTVYDAELLKKIRENAFAYLHGHEVGGTNPSLLEALASTSVNLLFDVGFNREVAEDAAFYWSKAEGSLVALIGSTERLTKREIKEIDARAKEAIRSRYTWASIEGRYRELFGSRCLSVSGQQ